MKRKDAFRKIRTLCERLDEVDPKTFYVIPRRMYLFGSVMTDKPDPANIDLVLVFDPSPQFDPDEIYMRLAYGKPLPEQQAATHLRRGMQRVRISTMERALENWQERSLFLVVQPRLIWERDGDWRSVIDDIEQSPTPWPGPLPTDAREKHEAYIKSMTRVEYLDKLVKTLAQIEGQTLAPASKIGAVPDA